MLFEERHLIKFSKLTFTILWFTSLVCIIDLFLCFYRLVTNTRFINVVLPDKFKCQLPTATEINSLILALLNGTSICCFIGSHV